MIVVCTHVILCAPSHTPLLSSPLHTTSLFTHYFPAHTPLPCSPHPPPPHITPLHTGYAPCIDALDEAAWARVAAGVITDRGPSECRLRWLSHFHPEANRAQWSAEVDDRLLELVGKYKERNVCVDFVWFCV